MAFIPDDVIQQVLDRGDIVELIASYIPLRPAGRNFKANCPFHHEKTPSFVVNPDKQIFHCFGCGVGGNVISFVMQQERMVFPEAVRLLAGRYSIEIEQPDSREREKGQIRQQLKHVHDLAAQYFSRNLFLQKSDDAQAARQYVKGRDISVDIAKKFRMGFALESWDGLLNFLKTANVSLAAMEKAGLIIPRSKGEGFYDRFRNRVMFPIFDVKGDCIAFGGRTMEKDNPSKYMNSPETPIYNKGSHLYGLHASRDEIIRQDEAIVVEGYMDFMTPFQHGVTNIVAALGTALTVEQIRLLRRFTHNVVLLFDADAAGQMASLRSLDLLIEEGMNVRVAGLAVDEDPDSFIRKEGVERFKDRVAQAESLVDFKLRMLLAQHGQATVEARAKVAAALLPTIDKFASAIVKSEYMKRLAHELALSPESLSEELKRLRLPEGDRRPSAKITTATAESKEEIRPAERDILKLMLQEKEFISLTKDEIGLEDFISGQVREVVSRLFTLLEEGNSVSPANLMNCFDDQKIQQLISSLLASEEGSLGDKKKIHRDCLNRLRQDKLKLLRQDIRQQMETARRAGDHEKLQQLAHEFNQSIKR